MVIKSRLDLIQTKNMGVKNKMATIIGAQTIGAEERRPKIKERMRRKSEQSRDRSRRKILELRRRYKIKVERNEQKMSKRKQHREKLGPTCVSLMHSRETEKQKRSAIGSLVPPKPKFSQAKTHAARIFGKRFELVEKGEI